MPVMVRAYIRSVVIGVLLACCFVGGLLALDVAHLRHLILTSDVGWIALLLMIVFNAIVFGGVQFALVIMGQAEKPDRPDKGGGLLRPLSPAPAPVGARSGREGRKSS